MLQATRRRDSSRGTHASELPSQHCVVQPSVGAREGKGDAAVRCEHGNIQIMTVASLEDRILRVLVDLGTGHQYVDRCKKVSVLEQVDASAAAEQAPEDKWKSSGI